MNNMSENNHLIQPTGIKKKRSVFPVIIVLVIVVVLMILMKINKPQIDKKGEAVVIPAVKTISIKPVDYVIPINGEGVILPKVQISFAAEITGKVTFVAPEFANGGSFSKGDVLVEIDPKDYELAITRAKANVAAQQASLDLEQAKSDLAKSDWKKYGKKGEPTALNLNLPQVDSAKAALAGAKADLLLAQRNLEKTRILAPFDGVILAKSVDVGQYVSPGMSLATIASVEVGEIRVALSDEQLKEGNLIHTDEKIEVQVASDEIPGVVWNGKVVQIEAQRDARTLLNNVVIDIKTPFEQQNVPLRFNTFVNVRFDGLVLKSVYPVDRNLVLLNDKMNFLNKESELEVRPVKVVYSDDENYFISEGLSEDSKIVSTKLSNITPGSKLKVVQK